MAHCFPLPQVLEGLAGGVAGRRRGAVARVPARAVLGRRLGLHARARQIEEVGRGAPSLQPCTRASVGDWASMLVRCKSTVRDVPQPLKPMARLGWWSSGYWRSCMIERHGMWRVLFCYPQLLGGPGVLWLGFLFRFVCTSEAEAVFSVLAKMAQLVHARADLPDRSARAVCGGDHVGGGTKGLTWVPWPD